MPAPNSYKVAGDLLKGPKFHSNLSKSPRTTIIEKMMKKAEKENYPSPQQYALNYRSQDANTMMGASSCRSKSENR